MFSRALRLLPLTACAAALLAGGFSLHRPARLAPSILQPAQLHSKHGCAATDWSTGILDGSMVGTACSTAHLVYDGGKMISNVKIVMVLYGSGNYASFLTNDTAPSMASFFSQVTNSSYMDWLTEYNTTTQSIGRGTYAGKYQITPAAGNNGSTITDTELQSELQSQILSHNLPAPDANTLYMVYFPTGKSINDGGFASCVSGGFCAYHSTSSVNGTEFYYGVFPDMSTGTGCDLGCGGSTQFNNQCSVCSHEMVESITDAEVGLATTVSAPLAWYWYGSANCQGEIGDICNANQGSFKGTDGFTYTVQKEWSNAAAACITSVPLSVSVGKLTNVKKGNSYTQDVTITNTSTTAVTGPITLIVDNLANGSFTSSTGTTGTILPKGTPYVSVSGNLKAGASTTVTLNFNNKSSNVTYTTRVVAGPGTR